jgi:outer membrane lipoprotein LolB
MSWRHARYPALLMVLALLVACAPARIRGDRALLAAQSAREAKLASRGGWLIEARLGVSDGHGGGSGDLTWRQQGDAYDFVLRAPVTGKSFHLHGDASGAVLEGLDQGTLRGIDAESLLQEALGWQVPMAELRDWVRGMRASNAPAELAFGADGLPSLLTQDGWKVEYRDWFAAMDPPLPRKVFAERGDYRVRVVIRTWAQP